MFFIMKYMSKKRMEGSFLPQLLEYNVVLSCTYFCFYAPFRNGKNVLVASIPKNVLEFPE